ncbi:hypothetical protein HNP00_004535 [Arthrobacter sp. AZCC_0090]|nr:hypothetical protein [Arthrobacter sp. AZCC_0090]
MSRAEVDEGLRPGTTTADLDRIAEREREVRELRLENPILKQASACLSRRSPTGRRGDVRARKEIRKALGCQDIPAAPCAVERLMRQKGTGCGSRT